MSKKLISSLNGDQVWEGREGGAGTRGERGKNTRLLSRNLCLRAPKGKWRKGGKEGKEVGSSGTSERRRKEKDEKLKREG